MFVVAVKIFDKVEMLSFTNKNDRDLFLEQLRARDCSFATAEYHAEEY